MEAWKRDFEWLRIRHYLKDAMKMASLPDLKGVLFLVGLQELGQLDKVFSKEEKQDLMHVAVCTLLEPEGFYKFIGKDADGWPHWENGKKILVQGSDAQESLLIEKLIEYFAIEDKYANEHLINLKKEINN